MRIFKLLTICPPVVFGSAVQFLSNMFLNNAGIKGQSALVAVIQSEVLCLQHKIYTAQKIKCRLSLKQRQLSEVVCLCIWWQKINVVSWEHQANIRIREEISMLYEACCLGKQVCISSELVLVHTRKMSLYMLMVSGY